MRFTPLILGAALSLAAAGGGAPPAAAGTLQVNPVLVEIGEGQRSGSVTITNAENVPVVIRAAVFEWRQENGEDRYTETAAMIVSPPVITIPAGGTQIVRVGPRTAATGSAPYRLIIEEVPDAQPTTGIRVALRLNLPLYIRMAAGQAADITWSARRTTDGAWSIEARNNGAGWVRINAQIAGAATGLTFDDGFAFGTILPGNIRRWTVGPRPVIADQQRFRQIGPNRDVPSPAPQRSR